MDTRPPAATAVPPSRRPDLVLAPQARGGCVVKDPRSGAYYELGQEETFLLSGLDGRQTVGDLCAAFRQRFRQPLTEAEVLEFVDLATTQGFVGPPGAAAPPPEVVPLTVAPPAPAAPAAGPPRTSGNLLYWRVNLFDPDRLFNRLAPPLAFVWTPAFVAASALAIAAAGAVAWENRGELVTTFAHAGRWETVLLGWLAIAFITTCHEFAHGLTCKRYGGEVHEVGFLMMMLMPCFYCNVSDAWLLPTKWRRMAVTLAGPYCDLCLWAAAVFVWRLTPPDGLANYLAWVVLSLCGLRTVLNANPLLKLDGYYLLADFTEIPNLLAKAQDYLKGWLRWGLWGAERPAPDPHGRLLIVYGLASWLFPMGMLVLLFWSAGKFFASFAGPAGAAVALVGGGLLLSGKFAGVFGPEVVAMTRTRPVRTAVWAVGLVGAAAALMWWDWADRAHGEFKLRPAARSELRAEVAGFLRWAAADEGDRVAPGQVVLRLEVPQLDTKLAQKYAERRESDARLKLLEVGPRPEVVAAQRARVGRAKEWKALAEGDLKHAREAYRADLDRLDKQLAEAKVEIEYARASVARVEGPTARGAVSGEELDAIMKRKRVSESRLEQAEAGRRARVEKGVLENESEWARRDRELAEAEAALGLMEAGTRPEELDAERARAERVREEIAHLERQRALQEVRATLPGVVVTPRVREGIGRYFREGELICTVEDPAELEAEISIPERDVARVRPGQPVELKVQVLPMETFRGKVDRVAPRAVEDKDRAKEQQGKVTVYCALDKEKSELRPGMTGHARVTCGSKPLGELVADRAVRFLRTEFWWW